MQFNKTTLPNGLRIVTVPMADNPSVTVLVMVQTGSKYETKKWSGLSHFLEHMVFKGTPRRPKASDISRELDSMGAQSNAFTSQEYTGYYAKADARHADAIIDVISDMYLNPLFEENEIRKEKGVIIEELRMYKDLPQRQVQEVLGELLYGDQPAGWSVIGTEETINSFGRNDFVAYRGDHYVAGATTVIVGGSFEEKEMVAKVGKAFAGISSDANKGKLPVKESQSAPQIATSFKETDQTHIALGIRSFGIMDPRQPAIQVLSGILGGGMSSRLFSKMRDELGICYYIRAAQDALTDHGELNISAGLDSSRVQQGIVGILDECERLKTDLVPEAEMKKVKDYIAGNLLLGLETSDARAEFAGDQEILKGHILTPDEIIKKINAVTAADIQKLAKEIFVNEGLNMAVVGKFKDAKAFEPYFKFK